jgi:tetratricopeptide (TPR) repeat protein
VKADDMHEYVSKVAVVKDLLVHHRTEEARPVARQVLAVAERIFGTESPEIVPALGLLARCLPAEKQVAPRERALRITEATHAPEHVNIVNALHHLGLALQDVGRRDEALTTFRRALDVSERTLGDEDPMRFTRELLRCTGGLLVDLHRSEEAIPLLEREARLAEATPSDDMTRMLARRMLGRALLDVGRHTEAATSLETALAIAERHEDEESPLVTHLRAWWTEAKHPRQ